MIVSIVIFKQLQYAENRPLGYNQENLLDIPAKKNVPRNFEILKNELTGLTGVKAVSAGSDNLLNFNSGKNGIRWSGKTPDQDFKMSVTYVQYDWAKTAGISLAEGRDFNPAFGTDSNACLLNEAAVRRMQIKGPVIGMLVDSHTVIGVIKDFVYDNPFSAPNPLLIYLGKGGLDHLFVRITNDDHWRQYVDDITQVVKKEEPGAPVDVHFTKHDYQQKFSDMRSGGNLVNGICCLAIFISCLGLFGLSSFVASRRIKEIAIRKVLGAGIGRIWFLLCQEFLKPVGIAFLLAAPLAAFVMSKALLKMEYHISLSWWMFALAGVLAILIAVITVSFHGLKAAMTKPVKALKSE
jgi:ABC-type antimicrobial peptide transport system permease subunit